MENGNICYYHKNIIYDTTTEAKLYLLQQQSTEFFDASNIDHMLNLYYTSAYIACISSDVFHQMYFMMQLLFISLIQSVTVE